MNESASVSEVTAKIEELLTLLAKECLMKLPKDPEAVCLEFLAKKNGVHVVSSVRLNRGKSIADEDLQAIEEDVNTELVSDNEGKRSKPLQRVYQSSNESDQDDESVGVKRITSYYSSEYRFEPTDECDSDLEDSAKVKTARPAEGRMESFHVPRPVCYLFSKEKISDVELDEKTKRYQDDERMKSLFRAWDGDGSGAVDFVELVLALHKFEQVAHAGIDIQVASDALLEFVESDTERELKLSEFTRVIILFALNNFDADFEDVADHMLDVATSTSETAALQAKTGADTTEIEAADKAEEEFLRETVKGMEEQVTDSIRKLRTKRVAFKQSGLEQSVDNERR